MPVSATYHVDHLEGTMEGWYQGSSMGSSAKGAHWVTFILLTCCTMYLFRDSWKAKGPTGKERFYAGYHEEYNISLYVNLFATIAYFGKIVADTMDHNYVNVGPLIIGLGNYRYADYMLTCPLLAYDLLNQVRAPYKVTGAILIFSVLMTGAATNFYPGQDMRTGAIAWFSFGCALYLWAYWLFFTVVKTQYERLQAMAHHTEAKKAFLPLRLAVYTFFTIWIVFPVIWVLGDQGIGLLSNEVAEVLHCLCDIVAKSFYGFALSRYRGYFDKKMFAVLEELGFDGEEELAHLEQDLKAMDGLGKNPEMNSTLGYAGAARRASVERRLSVEHDPYTGQHSPWQRRPSYSEWSPVPRESGKGNAILPGLLGQPQENAMGMGMGSPRRFSTLGGYGYSARPDSPRRDSPKRALNKREEGSRGQLNPAGLSVDQLKAQLELINMQLRAVEAESDTSPVEYRDDTRRHRSSNRKPKLQSDALLEKGDDRTNSSDSGADLQLLGEKAKHHPALTPRSGSTGRSRKGRDADDAGDGRGLC